MTPEEALELPGAHLELARMPGHWLLARMGKRVLRPGGLKLTRKLLAALAVGRADHVLEIAPGLGATTRLVLAFDPASYVGVERDEGAVRATERVLRSGRDVCHRGSAARTGLQAAAATVAFGEAMLTMQTGEQKRAIAREVHRVLRPGGRYGIHELALAPDVTDAEKAELQRALSDAIRVGARPLTVAEWSRVLGDEGFEVAWSATAPMALLEPGRVVADEGLLGTLRIAANVLRHPEARRRVLEMRSVFKRYASKMCAVALVATRRATGT